MRIKSQRLEPWPPRMHKLSSSGLLCDGVARLHAPGGADVRVEMSHPPQNRHMRTTH